MSGLILPDSMNDPRLIKPKSDKPDNSENPTIKFIMAKFKETPERAGELATFDWTSATVISPVEILKTANVPFDPDNENHTAIKVQGKKPIDLLYTPDSDTYNNMQIVAAQVLPKMPSNNRKQMIEQMKAQLIQMFLVGQTADLAQTQIPFFTYGVKYKIGDMIICSDTRNRLVNQVYTQLEVVVGIIPYTSEMTNLDGTTPFDSSKAQEDGVAEDGTNTLGDDTPTDNGLETPSEGEGTNT